MACLTSAEFIVLVPEYSATEATYLALVLSATCSIAGPGSCFGSKSTLAQAWLTAHYLAVGGGGEQGVITSQAIDQISASFGSTSFDAADASLASTKWGRLYLALRQTVPRIGAVVGRPALAVSGCGCG
jgi:hypothetical protein